MQGLHLQRPKEYDVRTFQRQSSPCRGIQAYRTIEAHGLAGCLGTWGRNTTRSYRRVQQSRETSDLTLSKCVFLKKRMSKPSMARRYCSLRQRIDFGLVGLNRPSRLTTRPRHSEGQLNDGSFYLRLLRRDFRVGTQLADQRSRPASAGRWNFTFSYRTSLVRDREVPCGP